MESVSYIELFYNYCKQEWCAVSYVSTFFGDIPPHFKQEESPFLSSFAKPFIGSTAYRLSAIRRFPFLAAKHSPSYRQRKRSLGFASDDDTRRMHFPHTLSLHDARDIHSLHCHFERSREILLALCSSLPLSRKASNFTLSHIRRYTGVQERSRTSLGMTLRKWRFPNISVVRYVK